MSASINPSMEAVEAGIAQMRAALAPAIAAGGREAVSARIVCRMTEAYVRAIAAERDLGSDMPDILGAFDAAIANIIVGVIKCFADDFDGRVAGCQIMLSHVADNLANTLSGAADLAEPDRSFDVVMPKQGRG